MTNTTALLFHTIPASTQKIFSHAGERCTFSRRVSQTASELPRVRHLAQQGLHHHCRYHPPHATPLFQSRGLSSASGLCCCCCCSMLLAPSPFSFLSCQTCCLFRCVCLLALQFSPLKLSCGRQLLCIPCYPP